MSHYELWEKVRFVLRNSTNERTYTTWLESTSLEAIEDSAIGKIIKIGVPGSMYREWISSNFMSALEKAVATHFQAPFKIELVINPLNLPQDPPPENLVPGGTETTEGSGNTKENQRKDFLNPEYTFGTFVVGQGNQFAHAACHSISERPGDSVNPLFVCGPSGTGKTHLLNAVGNSVREKNPNVRICYVSGERFINDVVTCIRHGQMDRFRRKYRESYDFLIMDDIHVISRTNSSQEEFFYTFNSFHDSGKQVVVASDKLPREMAGLEDRIRTRLEWGSTVDIQPPDIDTRMAILRYKAEKAGVYVPDEVITLIAKISKKSVRELEGNLATIRMYAELRGVAVTMDLSKEVFAATINHQKEGLTIEELISRVADHYQLTAKDLKSVSRVKTLVEPRQLAMYFARKLLDSGYAEIGRAFGKDHTTVIHAETKIKKMLQEDMDFKSIVSRLETGINNSQWTSM